MVSMGWEVLYRKWRPQTLAQVVGQYVVTETLCHAVEKGEIGHAYLFCGPRGTGKTSTARILAKAVNCPQQKGGEPCNTCDICTSITEGRALDVIEIDAASNRGIDDIRSLREKVNYSPQRARYKVYIIDEVHMLTEAAANALLKTLEEPPGHVIFILATTEPHKVISTIMSRCQRFDFRRLPQDAIATKLEGISHSENITITPEALRLIAHVAGGSLRDAENILQQLIAYHGREVDAGQVEEMLGVSEDSRIRPLVASIVNKDVSTGLKIINMVGSDAVNLRQFTQGLVKELRGLLLAKTRCGEILDVAADDLAEMERLVTEVDVGFLLRVVKRFADIDFRGNGYSTLPLELALVECSLSPVVVHGESSASSSEMIEQAAKGEEMEQAVVLSPSPTASSSPSKPPVSEDVSSTVGESDTGDIDYFHGQWRRFIDSLRGEGSGGTLDALLRSACEPIGIDNDTLVLGFYYPFHKEKIEEPKYKSLVEKKIKEIFGRPYAIRCVLIDSKKNTSLKRSKGSPLIQAALEMGGKIENG